MMGEEPLEVPAASSQQSSSNVIHTPPPIHQHHHHHYPRPQQQTQQLLDQQQQHSDSSPPVWIDNNAQQSERALSREKLVNAYGSSNSGSSGSSQQQQTAQVCSGNNNKLNTTPRRTRHRVDAGEPRGCFNSTNALPNLNHHAWGHVPQHQQQQRTNHLHRHVYPHFLPVVHPQFHQQQQQQHQQQQQRTRTSPPSDGYYFQPMKMLSEFISSASAVAAAQAAHAVNSSSPSRNSSADSQLLLREMLCKSANMSNVNNNNHDEYENSGSASEQHKSLKSSKLDGMIGLMMDKLSSSSPTPPPEVAQQQQSQLQQRENLLSSSEVASEERERNESADAVSEMEENNSTSNNNSAADLLNNNNPSSVAPVGGGGPGQVRNKRKKYQPQRSDLLECSEVGNGGIEDLEELDEDEAELLKEESEQDSNRRITRSQQRRIRNTVDPEEEEEAASDFTDMKPTRVKRKVSAEDCFSDIDEDEAMLLRPIASGSRSSAATTNPDDAESMIQEYENEEEEQEAMINDDLQHDQDRENEIGSRRTLPVVRNLMRIQQREQREQREREVSSVKEAPLTRQLLTSERPTSTPPTNTLEKSSSSILRNASQTPRSPPNADLPNGLNTNPANSFLQQWKENLKTTLMSHINELVDAQFSLLLGGGMIPPGLVLPPHLQQRMLTHEHERRSLRESNNSRSLQEPKVEQKRTPPPPQQQQQQQVNAQVNTSQNQRPQSRDVQQQQQQQQKPLIHLNGGSVLNTEKMAHIGSPPMSDVKKLPVGRASNSERSADYPGIPPRFPFMQNNERSMIPGGIQQNGKPHFSSALVGLSNHHLQQQAVAAAVAANAVAAAAGIENMFDNDGALSLVVGNRGGAGGNGGPHDIVHGNVTPRKKRHKVTDTRLTPRAVSRLLGQVDTTPASSTSPLYDHHAPSSSSPQASPHHHSTNPIEPRSILQNGTPPPRENTRGERTTPQASSQQNDPPRSIFNPFHPPGTAPGSTPFFHPAALAAAAAGHPLHPSQLARLDSPPMGNSLLHPALQNPAEYVERLREMSMEREHHQERNTRVGSDNVVVRDRGEHHHHHASLREYPSVRGLRDRGTGGGSIMLSNDVLDLIGRAGSAGGSDSGGESGSAFELGGGGGMYCKYSHTTSTLTPMHLRKAKLMFFWTRYPSSAVIKMYFPDIKFNKNNTAQLVKWFSNFREFYYIQMEKYARQALSEGVKQAEDLVVTTDSELYRVLNLHYNRNNHIEVPSNFRYVVEQTLREFFKSVQAGKDSEQSWKKAIYKIIARLDDPVPEYFKSPNFLEQLE